MTEQQRAMLVDLIAGWMESFARGGRGTNGRHPDRPGRHLVRVEWPDYCLDEYLQATTISVEQIAFKPSCA